MSLPFPPICHLPYLSFRPFLWGGTGWDVYVRSLVPRDGGAVSWFLDSLRTQCDMLEKNRVKMLKIQEAAKKVVPVESSVNLPVRLPQSGLSRQPATRRLLGPKPSGMNSLSKSNIYAQDLPCTPFRPAFWPRFVEIFRAGTSLSY